MRRAGFCTSGGRRESRYVPWSCVQTNNLQRFHEVDVMSRVLRAFALDPMARLFCSPRTCSRAPVRVQSDLCTPPHNQKTCPRSHRTPYSPNPGIPLEPEWWCGAVQRHRREKPVPKAHRRGCRDRFRVPNSNRRPKHQGGYDDGYVRLVVEVYPQIARGEAAGYLHPGRRCCHGGGGAAGVPGCAAEALFVAPVPEHQQSSRQSARRGDECEVRVYSLVPQDGRNCPWLLGLSSTFTPPLTHTTPPWTPLL